MTCTAILLRRFFRDCKCEVGFGRQGRRGWIVLTAMILALPAFSGCTAVLSPISGIPARKVPAEFLAQPRANWQQIDLARLRQDPPSTYQLDAGDILGIFIEGVLGDAETPPPVNFPEEGSELPPSIGYPMPVRSDGTVSLPLISPLKVQGLTVEQAEDVIRKAYIEDHQILKAGQDRIVITLLRERRYHVIVIREDTEKDSINQGGGRGGRGGISGSNQVGKGEVVELKAYQNDVLHALAATGGLPGLNAKDEVKILRGRLADAEKRDAFVQAFYQNYQDPCTCPPPLPDDPSTIRIPLRLPPGITPQFKPEDVILDDGDIVYIDSRETEFFYTGGLLPGGQFPLPRDYDLDVLGAMAIAGQGVGSRGAYGGGGSGGGGGGGGGNILTSLGGAVPTQLYILRQTPCNGQITIAVDATQAMNNQQERLLIKPGDTVILRYKCKEELANFGIATFFTFGIAELLRR